MNILSALLSMEELDCVSIRCFMTMASKKKQAVPANLSGIRLRKTDLNNPFLALCFSTRSVIKIHLRVRDYDLLGSDLVISAGQTMQYFKRL